MTSSEHGASHDESQSPRRSGRRMVPSKKILDTKGTSPKSSLKPKSNLTDCGTGLKQKVNSLLGPKKKKPKITYEDNTTL